MKEKIQKLLALAADSGATDAEKETALAMAQALMLKHNIELSALDNMDSKINCSDCSLRDFILPWHQLVVDAVGNLYTCKTIRWHEFYGKGTKYWHKKDKMWKEHGNYKLAGHKFVGRAESIDACVMTAIFIIKQIQEAWKVKNKMDGGHCTRADRESFCFGAAQAVNQRIAKMVYSKMNDNDEALKATGCTALVVQSSVKKQLDDIADFCKINLDLAPSKDIMNTKVNYSAVHGMEAGKRVRILQDLKAEDTTLKLEHKS